jgi:hypothetical protein
MYDIELPVVPAEFKGEVLSVGWAQQQCTAIRAAP